MNQKVRVLNFSTHDEDCGIGKYHEMFVEALANNDHIKTKFFEVSPNQLKRMQPAEQDDVFRQMASELEDYDMLHIQHEFGFYLGTEFARACQLAKQMNKKLIVTYHTSPDVAIKPIHLGGLGPRSIIHYARQKRYRTRMIAQHIAPAANADIVIVHNELTKQALVSLGIPAARITRLYLPVPVIKTYKTASTEISNALNKQAGDRIYCTVGFMHRYKGLTDAVRALNYLPANHKLAIIGGIHPEADDIKIYNDIADLIIKYKLQDRVYITGFIKDDDRLNQLISECDLCVYPYDGVYYARVSSAALNLAFSNLVPVVAYPVATFREINEQSDAMLLTNGFSYYELARSIKDVDLKALGEKSARYAKEKSYPVITEDLVKIYQSA